VPACDLERQKPTYEVDQVLGGTVVLVARVPKALLYVVTDVSNILYILLQVIAELLSRHFVAK
jgi:hypothetical protein